jgi:hypothetical protein
VPGASLPIAAPPPRLCSGCAHYLASGPAGGACYSLDATHRPKVQSHGFWFDGPVERLYGKARAPGDTCKHYERTPTK